MPNKAWRVSAEGMAAAEGASPQLMMLRVGRGDDATIAAIGAAAGITLSDQPNVVAGSGSRAIWMGPQEWMLVDYGRDSAALEAAAQGATVLANDVSAGRYVVAATGSAIRDLLAKGTSLDLHQRLFAAGSSAMTLFAQVPVVIECRNADEFWMYFDTSYRAYVRRWFEDAVVEFGNDAG